MPDRWIHRLGRCLPADSYRDLFAPALADLDYETAQRLHRAAPARQRAWIRCRFSLAALLLLADCLRLAGIDRLRSRLSGRPDASAAKPRKELLIMIARDVRHALRMFVREPAFTAAAVLTLTLGIGANTALFAVVEAVLLRPLPYAGADRLVLVKHRDTNTSLTKWDIAIGDFVDLKARQQSFETFGGYGAVQSTLLGGREPVRVEGASLTPEVFGLLGVQPAMGRFFTPDDVREGAAPVVVISHELWRTELGSDPQILSRSIQLGPTRRLVVGVTPPGFRFPPAERTDVILPARVPATAPSARKSGWIYGIGRLEDGVSVAAAEAEFAALSQQFAAEYPQQNQGSLYFTADAARRTGRRHQATAPDAARGSGLRAAHCLRERWQSTARAIPVTAAGTGDATCTRRGAQSRRRAAPHRGPWCCRSPVASPECSWRGVLPRRSRR